MTDDDRVASILGAWQEARDRGETLDSEAVIAAHPDLAGELRAKFEALAELDGALRDAPRRLRALPPDRYTEFKPVGEGGMGIVYWAIDTDLNREVAFKVIRPGGGEGDRPTPTEPAALSAPRRDTPASQAFETLKQRFLQEAWVTGGLSHPGIVPVYELGETTEGVPYYTMRFVKGERTLADAIEEAKEKGIEERLKLLEPFLKVCDTLSYAHAKGVIHRDLKPDNIALGEFGEVVVIDWGLAKIQDRPDVAQERWQDRIQEYRDATDLRTVASAMGTPGYMAPEAAKGQAGQMDARSDVYSLGAILFQILTGRLPFAFQTFGELVLKVLREDPPAAKDVDPAVPAELSGLCRHCLARERDERVECPEEVAERIRAWQARSAADREIEGLLRDAETALTSALGLSGDARLKMLDRAAASASQVQERRAGHEGARAIEDRIRALRQEGMRERARAERRRVLVRGGIAVLVLGVLVAVLVIGLLERRRQEAEDARVREASERARADQAAADAREASREAERERDAKARALTRARALGLAAASRTVELQDPMLSLLLARESLRAAPRPEGTARLRQALLALPRRVALAGHEGFVSDAVFSPDGTRVLTASHDGTARLWNLEGQELAVFRGHTDGVWSAAFSPDGTRLVTASADRTARIWSLLGHELVRLEGHTDGVRQAVFSPDGTRVLSVSRDKTARLWDSAGRTATVLQGKEHGFSSAMFLPDGMHVLTVDEDAARLWSVQGEEVARMVSEDQETTCAAVSRDGTRVVTGYETSFGTASACVFDLRGREQGRLQGHEDRVRSVVFSPDGMHVLTASSDGTARLWDLDGREVSAVSGHSGHMKGAIFSPDGTRILTHGYDASARLWDLRGQEQGVLRGAESPFVHRAAFSPDGNAVLTVSRDETVLLWHLGGREVAVLAGHDAALGSAAFSPGGALVLAWQPGTARLWDLRGHLRTVLRGPVHGVHPPVFSRDGTSVLAALADGTARLWDLAGRELACFEGHEGWLTGATFSPDGRMVLTGSLDGTARLWDLGGNELAVLRGHDDFAVEAAFSPDGRRILTSDYDKARLWDLEGNLAVALGGEGEEEVQLATFSPDGERVVASLESGIVRVWDLDGRVRLEVEPERSIHGLCPVLSPDGTRLLAILQPPSAAQLWDLEGRVLATLPLHTEGDWHRVPNHLEVFLATFSPDGSLILTASREDRFARLWDRDGRPVAVLEGHEAGLRSAVFSPDGTLVLTASDDRTARLWDLEGRELAVLRGHTRSVSGAGFSSDGRLVLTASDDGTARVYYVHLEDLLRLADERITRDFTPEERERYADLLSPETGD